MKVLVDMNLAPRWAQALAKAGLQAHHWSDIGAGNASDAEIMSYARMHGFCVLTHDLDFATILALTNWDKPSVIQIRAGDTSPEAIGDVTLRALVQFASEIEAGAVLTIDPVRARVRILPFRPS